MAKFPKHAANPVGNIRVRVLGDSALHTAYTDPAYGYVDVAVYPQYEHTKHVLCIRSPNDGKLKPITEFADNAARVAAGPTVGLLNASVPKGAEAQRVVLYATASKVEFELDSPQTLGVTEIWIHPVVDSDTSKLHPFKVVVNGTKANSIGKLSEYVARSTPAKTVVGHFVSEYIQDLYE